MKFRALLLLLVLAGCKRPEARPVAGAGFEQLRADQVITGFEQYVTEGGAKRAVMRGDTAYIFEDSGLVKVQHANLTMFDEQGRVSARLTSRSGDVRNETQAMVARGNVVLIAQDGRRIETEELFYDPQAHRVWSHVQTVQRHQGGVLTGSGFDADDKFNNVRINNARSTGGGLKIQF